MGRRPSFERNSDNLPIGDYLFSQSNKIKDCKEKAINNYENNYIQESLQKFTQSTSSKMIEKMKYESFNKIFSMLDSDKDGVISQEKISIDSIK